MRLLIALFCLMLFFGCTSPPVAGNGTVNMTPSGASQDQTPSPPPQPPSQNTKPVETTCEQYCPTLTHVLCTGHWSIQGQYPDCACEFVCDQNDSAQEPAKPQEPLATPTEKSVEEMLDSALEAQRSDFYMNHSGKFSEKTYKWIRYGNGAEGITLSPATDVEFDGEPISTIRAIGFIAFESDDFQEASAVAIFNATRTPLDNYTGTDTFSIDFFPAMIDKNLRDCWAYTKDFNLDRDSAWMLTYYIKCERIRDK